MESLRKIIECDGPTCKEWAPLLEDGENLPEGWTVHDEGKTHIHSEQCGTLYLVSQTFGFLESSKSMTPADYLRAIADKIEGIQEPLSITKRIGIEPLNIEIPEGRDRPTIRATVLAILQQHPGLHSVEEIRSLAAGHGYDLAPTQISPALASRDLREKYPQVVSEVEEREGLPKRSRYGWDPKKKK